MAPIHVTLFHLICFLITGFGLYYDTFVITYGWTVYGGKTRYATYWDIVLQTIYFGLAFTSDINLGEKFNKHSLNDPFGKLKLKRLVRYISCGMAFPLGNFVTLSFWGLYLYNREFIYPTYLDKIIPWWLNHILHTLPLTLQFLDKFISYQPYPKKLNGVLGILGLTGCYQIWMIWIAYYDRTWIYPILDYLPLMYRVLFLASMWGCLATLYFVGEFLAYIFWNRRSRKTEKLF